MDALVPKNVDEQIFQILERNKAYYKLRMVALTVREGINSEIKWYKPTYNIVRGSQRSLRKLWGLAITLIQEHRVYS